MAKPRLSCPDRLAEEWDNLHRESRRQGHRDLASRCGVNAQAEDCPTLGSGTA